MIRIINFSSEIGLYDLFHIPIYGYAHSFSAARMI